MVNSDDNRQDVNGRQFYKDDDQYTLVEISQIKTEDQTCSLGNVRLSEF